MKKTKIILVVILGSVVLFACLGFLGYFGVKTMRRNHLRAEAREAFAAEEWKTAGKLLQAYVAQDPDSEEDIVRLAQVYRHFGNAEEEMRCWSRANVLNPLKPEYWDNYTESAQRARAFQHLYASLIYKINSHAKLAPIDQMRYLICAFITNRVKEATQYYQRMLKADPTAFQQDDLGRFAEFLMTYDDLAPGERTRFIERGTKSDDPFVRQESVMLSLADLVSSGSDAASIDEQMETMLKQMAELNRFVGVPLLANFYFTHQRFDSVIEIAEPYLADIDDLLVSVFYAESCVYGAQPEKLKPLIEHFRSIGQKYRMQTAYFEALYDFSRDDDDFARHLMEVGSAAQTSLANLMNLQVALNNDNVEKIASLLETIMTSPPFCDLRERSRTAVRHYLGTKIRENPDLAGDPRFIKIARLVSDGKNDDPFLMRISISDQRDRNVLTRQILQENFAVFPQDPFLLEVAAEFELFNGNPEKCLEYVERFYDQKREERLITFDLLHMLALELTGQVEEATKEFTALVDHTEMDREILYRYLKFCIDHERKEELSKMADRLDASEKPDLKSLAPFFRAETLLLQGKKDEALSLLKTAKTDNPDFAFRAANLFSTYDVRDEALSRYLALLDDYPDKRLVLANIAEIYLAKEKKAEALSYAKKAWEADQEALIGQYVYAKMLVAVGRYQDAEKVLTIPNRQVELPDTIKDVWTDIMTHCVQEDVEKGAYSRALDRAKHYLVIFPDDPGFLEFKARAEKELKRSQVLPKKDAETDTSEAAAS